MSMTKEKLALIRQRAQQEKDREAKRKAPSTTSKPPPEPPQELALEITESGTPVLALPTYDVAQGRLLGVVGQRLRFGVRANRPDQAVIQPSWTIPGPVVQSCTQTPNLGQSAGLAEADLAAAEVTLHWLQGGVRTVQVTGLVDGQQLTATVDCEMLAPAVEAFRITTSGVNVCQDGEYLEPGVWLALYAPGAAARPGCAWQARVRAPFRQFGNRILGNGKVGFVQLANFDVRGTRIGSDDRSFYISSHINDDPDHQTNYTLDNGTSDEIIYDSAKVVLAGSAVEFGPGDGITFSDSPGVRLPENFGAGGRRDRYRLYLMYKPSLDGSVWITLGRADWGWSARTERMIPTDASTPWRPPMDVEVIPVAPTDGLVTSELPAWTRRGHQIQEQGWQVRMHDG